ncbi:MAG: hypothetical protein ACRC67_38895 [Inquilinus sp.]|uniref:hypothetical protein n=1 Tax=Inquilinus sp. TaxID=1932117 RepID=UPI003F3EF492
MDDLQDLPASPAVFDWVHAVTGGGRPDLNPDADPPRTWLELAHKGGSVAQNWLVSATVVEDLRRFDNQDYLNELRASPDFTGLRGDLDRLTACLAEPGLEVTAKAFKGLIDTARGDLDLFQDGVHPGKRLALTLATLVFYPLPFTVAAFQGDLLYATRAQSNYARSTSSVLGMLCEPVADFRLFYQHTQERLWPFVAPGAIYAGPAFAESLHHLRHSGPFAGYAAAGTAASLFLATYGQDGIRALKARLNPVLTGTAPTTAQLRTTLGEILDDMEGRLARIDQLLEGKKVSDNLSAELLFMRKDWGALIAAMRKIVFPSGQAAIAESEEGGTVADPGEDGTVAVAEEDEAATGTADAWKNPKATKYAFAVIGTAIVGLNAYLVSDEKVALADYAGWGAWVVVQLFVSAADSDVTPQDMARLFKSLVSGTTVALPLSTAAFVTKGEMLDSTAGLVASMVSLTVTNLTISGKIGTWLAQALLALLPIVIAGATFCFQCGGARKADKGKGRAVEPDPDDAVAVSEPGYVLGELSFERPEEEDPIDLDKWFEQRLAGEASGRGLGKSGSIQPVAEEDAEDIAEDPRDPPSEAEGDRSATPPPVEEPAETTDEPRDPTPDAEDTRSATPPPSQKDR